MDVVDSLRAAFDTLNAGDSAEAESRFRAILAQAPHHPQALQGLGKSLFDQLRLEQAEQIFTEAIAVEELPARAIYHLGLCRLLRGNYAKGWQGWEKRLEVPPFDHVRMALPRWIEGKPPGRRLLVVAEQGYGDTIQFSRFLPRLLKEQGGDIAFACPAPLLPLYAPWGRMHRLTVSDSLRVEEFDSFVPICSLGSIFKVRVDDLPGDLPELSVDAEKVARWKNARPPGRRVAGLCWAGRPEHPQDKSRSLSPGHLLGLRTLPDIALVGLQRPPCDSAAPAGLLDADWGPAIVDFSDFAAMLLALDVVVTVDTAVAHLAGTLGLPTYLMIPFAPDWRWLLEREDSPWYPSVRLFRQPQPADWATVVANLTAALAGLPSLTSAPAGASGRATQTSGATPD